jgi:ATP-dependent exoDNAse (exonuclease V) beta subunit
MLSQQHPHVRDSNVVYVDKDHKYILTESGKECISVTTLLSTIFPSFDGKKEAEKIVNKGKNEKYRDMTTEEILLAWSKNNEKSIDDGKKLHNYIEKYFNKEKAKGIGKEYIYFHNFVDNVFINPYRTEWPIYDEETLIAGTLDFLFLDSQGKYCLCDWKRNKFIDVENRFNKWFNLGDIRIANTSYMKYTLQLNLYAYILKKHYNINVEIMFLVNLYPDEDDFCVFPIEKRDDLIEKIITPRLFSNNLL